MTRNVWPRTKEEARKCVISLATCIAPICSNDEILELPYAPLQCEKKSCSAAANPYTDVNFTKKICIPFAAQF
ncbi:protein transport protein SEC23-like protein [Corchorus olitorius]|uniref:Protein transport protein SEC23-like protein n=1 Tax=Corchorus olitorius TaxID=93759 RepID=A0A1R3H3K1_9ROSI|nr:protein transport protein SEC23-like protein [Corchorus olitorius]